jgi:hypothetical protein
LPYAHGEVKVEGRAKGLVFLRVRGKEAPRSSNLVRMRIKVREETRKETLKIFASVGIYS